MIFERLTVRNFLSIGDEAVLFQPGLHFVTGKNYDMDPTGSETNGVGKTALLADSIEYALYGTVARKANVSDLANRATEGGCEVEVVVQIDERVLRVRRFRDLEDEGTGLQLFVDGENRSAHIVSETQERIEELLPLSRQVFRHGIMVGQGMPFRFLELSESQKQDLLCEIIELDIYDRAAARAKEKLAVISEARKERESKLEERQRSIETLDAKRERAKRALEEYEASIEGEREDLEQQIEELGIAIKSVHAMIENRKVKVEELEAEEAARVPDLEDATDLVAQWEDAWQRAKQAQRDAENGLHEVQMEWQKRKALATRAREQYRRFEQLNEECDGVCPKCLQPVDPEHVEEHLAEIQREIEQQEQQADIWGESVEATKEIVEQKREAAADTTESRADAESYRLGISNEVAELQRQQQKLKDENARDQEKRQKHQEKRDRLQKQLSEFTSQAGEYRAKVEAHEEALDELEADVPELEEELQNVLVEEEHVEWWKAAIPQLRAAAVSGILDFLNQRVAHYMEHFSGGTMGTALYQKQHGSGSRIKVDVRTPGGSYGISSGGERRRIDLALYLAQADLIQASAGIRCNLLVCDEITDNLSPLGIQQLLALLREKADAGLCVYVVSHNPAVRSAASFDSELLLVKEGGVARQVVREAVAV